MSSTPFMKLYIGDYLGDTMHLSCLEHGAYLLLIMAYWQNKGPLKSDANALQMYTRSTKKEYEKWNKNVLQLFEVEDGYLIHKRIDKELKERMQVSDEHRLAARKRWSQDDANAMQTQCKRNAIQNSYSDSYSEEYKKENIRKALPSESLHKSSKQFQIPTIDEIIAYCKERGSVVNPHKWLSHYEANGWMVGKTKMKDWKAAIRTWEPEGHTVAKKEKPLCPHCGVPLFDEHCDNKDCPQYA